MPPEESDTTTYQFEAETELWQRWRNTVPRGKTLEERINELLEADAEGRVREEGTAAPAAGVDDAPREHAPTEHVGDEPQTEPDEQAGPLTEVELPSDVDRDAADDTVRAVRDYLAAEGPASKREIVLNVMPDHSLGYSVPELEPGDRYRGSWWRKVVKPGLDALDDVEYRGNHGDYRVKP